MLVDTTLFISYTYHTCLDLHAMWVNFGSFWVILGHCMSLSLIDYGVILVSKSEPVATLVEIIIKE